MNSLKIHYKDRFLKGVLIALAVFVLFFIFPLPAARGANAQVKLDAEIFLAPMTSEEEGSSLSGESRFGADYSEYGRPGSYQGQNTARIKADSNTQLFIGFENLLKYVKNFFEEVEGFFETNLKVGLNTQLKL